MPPGGEAASGLHVGLNLIYLVPGETGGTETYARELIPALVAAVPELKLTAFVGREAAGARDAPWGSLIPAVVVPVRATNRVEWVRGEQALLPQGRGSRRGPGAQPRVDGPRRGAFPSRDHHP